MGPVNSAWVHYSLLKSQNMRLEKKKKRKERNANTDPNGYLVSTNTTHAYCNNTWNRLYRDIYTHTAHTIFTGNLPPTFIT